MEPLRNRVVHRSAHLEPTHCRAIYEEIGERLRHDPDWGRSPVPLRLRMLLDRVDETDTVLNRPLSDGI
jgi:hypothetical protein